MSGKLQKLSRCLWQEARSQCFLPSLCFSGQLEKKDGRPGLWFPETFSTSPLILLNRIQRNLTGSKISISSAPSCDLKRSHMRSKLWFCDLILRKVAKLRTKFKTTIESVFVWWGEFNRFYTDSFLDINIVLYVKVQEFRINVNNSWKKMAPKYKRMLRDFGFSGDIKKLREG